MSTSTNKKTARTDAYRGVAAMVGALVVLTPIAMFGVVALALPKAGAHPLSEVAAKLGTEPARLVVGEIVYRNHCSLCHGKSADGVAHLGKPLRNSEFVQSRSDDELFAVIVQGRLPGDPENTTGTAMPARGNTGASDDDLRSVVAYLRMIQDPSEPFASLDDWAKPEPGSTALAGIDSVGHDAFIASCSPCHGTQGEGREGLGKALRGSEFVASVSEADLIKFVKTGRPSWDEANTTGLDMPPKGGNPALSDDQIKVIVSYIRNLHETQGGQ